MEPNTPIELPATVDPGPPGRDWSVEGQCLQCGYALRGLISNRCPECGRPFDRYDRNTLRLPKHLRSRKPKRRRSMSIGLQTFVLFVAALIIIPISYLNRYDEVLFAYAWLLIGAAIIQWVLYALLSAKWPDELTDAASLRRWALPTFLILLVDIAISVTTDHCPHADYYGIGPFIIATHNIDPQGPCHNHRTMQPLVMGNR